MDKHETLSKMERKLFSNNFQDGFIDLLFSVVFLQTALIVFVSRLTEDNFWLYLSMSAVSLIFIGGAFLVRKYITAPRIGYIRFSRKRRKTTVAFLILDILVLAAGLAISFKIINIDSIINPGIYTILPIAAIILVLFTLAALAFNILRLHIYGWIAAAAFPFGKWLDTLTGSRYALPLLLLTVSLLMLGISLIILILFVRRNPLRKEDKYGE